MFELPSWMAILDFYDQDPAFMSSLAQYFFQQFGIKILRVNITTHKSLLAENGIKSLSNTEMKHLYGLGCGWDHYWD